MFVFKLSPSVFFVLH